MYVPTATHDQKGITVVRGIGVKGLVCWLEMVNSMRS
jgi:hypothetical protein